MGEKKQEKKMIYADALQVNLKEQPTNLSKSCGSKTGLIGSEESSSSVSGLSETICI